MAGAGQDFGGSGGPFRSPEQSIREIFEQHRDAIVTGLAIVLALGLASALPVAGYILEQAPHRLFKIAGAGVVLFLFLSRPSLLLPVIALALPFADWLPKSPIPLVNTTNILVGGSFLTIAALAMQRNLPGRRVSPISTPLLLFTGWLIFSWAYGAFLWPDRMGGGFGRLRHLWGILSAFSIYFIVWYLTPDVRTLRRLSGVLIAASTLGAAGPAIEAFQNGFGFRTPGGVGDINKMGAFLAVAAVYAFGMLPAYERRGRLFVSIGVLASTLGLIFPNSRGAYVGFLAAALPSALRRSVGATVFLVALLSAGVLLAPSFVRERVGATWSAAAAEDRETALDADSGGRITVWKQIIEVIEGSPIVGVGYTNLMLATKLTAGNYKHAHNLYLEVAGEMGIVGLVLLLWLFVRGWKLAGVLQTRSGWVASLGRAYRSVILCYAVLNVFGQRFLDFSLAGFFFYLTALVAVAEHDTREPAATEVHSS